MGLISGIIGLPLAPLRGTVALGRVIQEHAEKQLHDPAIIRAQLEEVDRRREAGLLTDDEATEWEDVLIERLMRSES